MLNTSNLSPDEGVDLNSSEVVPGGGSGSNELNSSVLAVAAKNDHHNYGRTITFKRTAAPVATPHNVFSPMVVFSEGSAEKTDYSDMTDTPNGKSSKSGFLSKLFKSRNLPKRLNSQTSTGTTSTYISSVYSDGSNQSPRFLAPNFSDFFAHSSSIDEQQQQTPLLPVSSQMASRSNSSGSNGSSSAYNHSQESTNALLFSKFNRATNRQRENANTNSGKPTL
jgi:hypothetical protein